MYTLSKTLCTTESIPQGYESSNGFLFPFVPCFFFSGNIHYPLPKFIPTQHGGGGSCSNRHGGFPFPQGMVYPALTCHVFPMGTDSSSISPQGDPSMAILPVVLPGWIAIFLSSFPS